MCKTVRYEVCYYFMHWGELFVTTLKSWPLVENQFKSVIYSETVRFKEAWNFAIISLWLKIKFGKIQKAHTNLKKKMSILCFYFLSGISFSPSYFIKSFFFIRKFRFNLLRLCHDSLIQYIVYLLREYIDGNQCNQQYVRNKCKKRIKYLLKRVVLLNYIKANCDRHRAYINIKDHLQEI